MKCIAVFVFLTLCLLTGCSQSTPKLLATANKYHENKQYREADILYQKVIAKDKTNAEAYYREGLNLIAEGDPGQATRFLRRAVDLKPANTDAASKLANIYLTAFLSNPVKYKMVLPEITDLKNKILKQDPNSFDGLRLEALTDVANHKLDDGVQAFAKANQIKPNSPDLAGWYAQALVMQNHPDDAEKLVRQTLNQNPTWAAGYIFLFELAGKNNDRVKQETILRERLKNDPKNPAAVTGLANFLLATNRFDEAETVMKPVLNDKQAFPGGPEMLGDFYSRAKKYDQAIQEYQAGTQQDSKNALHYQQRVVAVYMLEGKREEALQLARSLATANPKDSGTNQIYASLLLETGLRSDAAKSLAELKRLVKQDPSNAMLHLNLSRAYMETNHVDDATSEATEALQEEAKGKTPRATVLVPARMVLARVNLAKGQYAQALEQTQQILQTDTNNPDGRLLRDEALVGLNQGDQAKPDLEKLVAEIDQAGNHSPEANQARLMLGQFYVKDQQWDKANAQFNAVWKGNPPDYRGFEALQEVSVARGDTGAALTAMGDFVNHNPNAVAPRFDLANLQAKAGLMAARTNQDKAKALLGEAIDNYKQILKVNPKSAVVWTRLGLLQAQLGQTEPALASFDEAVSADSQNPEALLNRAMLYDHLGRRKEAVDSYNRVLGVDPNNTMALNNLAFLNADTKTNLEQAQSFAERAKKRAPNSPDISDTLGYVYYQRNLNAEALQIFRQDVQDRPDNPTFHLHLAMALLKSGDKSGAREEANKAMKTATPAQEGQIKSFVSQIG